MLGLSSESDALVHKVSHHRALDADIDTSVSRMVACITPVPREEHSGLVEVPKELDRSWQSKVP